MFIILGGLLFLLVAALILSRAQTKRSTSARIIICMVSAAMGALIGAFFEMFQPLSTERIEEIKRTQAPCVVQAISQSTDTPSEMALLKIMTECNEMKPKE